MRILDTLLARLAEPHDKQVLLAPRKPSWRERVRIISRITRRHLWLYSILFVAALAWVGATGMDVYHRTEMPEFCSACHEMGHNFRTWSQSRHASIKCIDCHAESGLMGYAKAKLGGIAQLYIHLTAKTITEIHMQAKHDQTVSDNCKRCHASTARAADRSGRTIAHKRHTELGVQCVSCHSGNVAHPPPSAATDPLAGLVDVKTCFTCHDGNHQVGETKAFAVAESSCGKCHPDTHFAPLHFEPRHLAEGEVAKDTHQLKDNGGQPRKPCLDCHAQAAGEKHYRFDRKQEAAICANCHPANTETASRHKPFAEGKCGSCHQVMVPAYLLHDGPVPTQATCTRCHQDVQKALGTAEPPTPTQFADGKTDLHRQHKGDVGDGPGLCLRCHDPHASNSARAMIKLRGDKGEPGVFTATPTGGRCTGACHDDDKVAYDRTGKKVDDDDDDAKPAGAATPTTAAAPKEEE